MTTTLKRYLPGLAVLVLLTGPQVKATSTITVKLTIVAPPPCVINHNSPIEVDFGNDVLTTRVDGSYKKMPLSYTVECTGAPSNAMKLQVLGNGADFDTDVLRTNQNGLGVALLRNGKVQPINRWLNFTYPNLPQFEVVPVKQAGVSLSGGAFSAGATMKVDYQ